jgi:uncharacterized protein YndB with AHSA1/START domain
MAANSVIFSQDCVVVDTFVAAPPERVFAAITDPQQVVNWWGESTAYRVKQWQGDLRPGGKWRSDGTKADGTAFYVRGEYVEIDPPRLLVHTWIPSYLENLETVVRWELQAKDGGTLVTVRHSGFGSNVETANNHNKGWVRVLGWMRQFVETGETVTSRQ